MQELPQTDDLPRSEAGYDPARVEEAFAEFADRVRELESVASELRSELHALRADRGSGAAFRSTGEEWPADAAGAERYSPDWVAAVPPPLARRHAVPRLAVEGVFLLAVALLAGLADLDAVWIVLVMAAAWSLVVLGEWAAAAKRERWHLDDVAQPLEEHPAAAAQNPWDVPVVEGTVIEGAAEPESQTVVTALPAQPEVEAESSPEAEPTTKRRRLWRRRPAEATASDPWEA